MSGALIAAASITKPPIIVVYTLSGSSGTPNVVSHNTTSPTNAQAEWAFFANGTVFKVAAGSTQFQDGIEWTDEQDTPTVDIWIRATADSGDSPTSGPALNTWHVLQGSGEATRTWVWLETGNGFFSTVGTIKVEISTDSGGVTIVATGYYRGAANVEL